MPQSEPEWIDPISQRMTQKPVDWSHGSRSYLHTNIGTVKWREVDNNITTISNLVVSGISSTTNYLAPPRTTKDVFYDAAAVVGIGTIFVMSCWVMVWNIKRMIRFWKEFR